MAFPNQVPIMLSSKHKDEIYEKALVFVGLDSYTPFVVAQGYDRNNKCWSSGKYFTDILDAYCEMNSINRVDITDELSELIKWGLKNGIVDVNHREEACGDIVCTIGENWFYFAGMEAESMSMDAFLEAFDTDTQTSMITEAIKDLDATERNYYFYFLSEAKASKE